MYTIEAAGATALLWPVVVGAGVEHVQDAVVTEERWAFDAIAFPRQFWTQDTLVTELLPVVRTERGGQRCGCDSYELLFEIRIAGGPVEQ